MIYRIYPSRDTFITNALSDYSRKTGSNVGYSEELQIFKQAGISGVIGTFASASIARTLMQFDLAGYSALTASGDIPTGSLEFRLRVNHKTSDGPLPASYDILISPVSSSWDEGRGMDVAFNDRGYANWEKRTSQNYWTTRGGDFLLAPSASAHFDSGYENIDVDVSPIARAWLTGGLVNNGIALRISGSIEGDLEYTDCYTKKFYSRQTDFLDRAPYIEVRSNDFCADDRVNMKWGRTGSLVIYNLVGGVYVDLAGEVVTSISDASGVLMYVTASHTGLGRYASSFSLPSSSFSGSLFHDSWRAGSVALVTGSFTVDRPGPTTYVQKSPLTVRVRNLQDEYQIDDWPTLEVLFRDRPMNQPVLSTASLGSRPYIVEKAYYAIENDSTGERVVPFGTGSTEHTRLSYGAEGNYFKFCMNNLHAGNVYRLIFLVYDRGSRTVVDNGIRFKIV